MNKIAYVGRVTNVAPIDGADFIDSCTVVCGSGGKWVGTVHEETKVGDLVEVYLQDCIVPKEDRFHFMEKYKYIVKMKRFKGTPSECLIMPLTIVGDVGDDISNIIGCTKYEKALPTSIHGDTLTTFPQFIRKTDELNFQSANDLVSTLIGKKFYSTLKIDGTSCTMYKADGHFGVCSRNLELKENVKNAFWKIAKKYRLDELLPDGYAIQGEVAGPGIQGNSCKLREIEFFLFNVYDINKRQYLDFHQMLHFISTSQMKIYTVPIIEHSNIFELKGDEALRRYAERSYQNGGCAEGVVFRPINEVIVNGNRLSFKVVNLFYKC